ncbi:MAG TPA: oxygenase MpaB family protein [Candidatus Limnocylindrales bacterium]|nr:oxygenase MpaB family protein [Candidatus Limnocylindrales bacterium]
MATTRSSATNDTADSVTRPMHAATPAHAREPRPDPVLGFYGPGTQMWRINREAVLLGAGPCALLLQVAHPLVAEGVAQHSDFESDPAGRLRRTLRTTLDLVFGDGASAERAVGRLNSVHGSVRGTVDDPEARHLAEHYRALDPGLLLWVQATLIVTSVRAHERWVGPLSAAEKEAFWQEARSVGRRIGIPLASSPPDWPALAAYYEAMIGPDGPVRVTPTARRLARSILRLPLPGLPAVAGELLTLPALALLPARLRGAYELPWGPGRERLARMLDLGVRLWVRALPTAWRSMPQALAAERRARRDPGTSRERRARRAPPAPR